MDGGLCNRNTHLDPTWTSIPRYWIPLGSPSLDPDSNRCSPRIPETLGKSRRIKQQTMAPRAPTRCTISSRHFRRNVLDDSSGKYSILLSVPRQRPFLSVAEQCTFVGLPLRCTSHAVARGFYAEQFSCDNTRGILRLGQSVP